MSDAQKKTILVVDSAFLSSHISQALINYAHFVTCIHIY